VRAASRSCSSARELERRRFWQCCTPWRPRSQASRFGGSTGHAIGEHPFRNESRALLQELKYGRSYIQYSRPGPSDQKGIYFDAAGHLAVSAFDEIGIPHESQFYLCGPPAFLQELTADLAAWGVPADRIHTEIFGTLDAITPGMKAGTYSP